MASLHATWKVTGDWDGLMPNPGCSGGTLHKRFLNTESAYVPRPLKVPCGQPYIFQRLLGSSVAGDSEQRTCKGRGSGGILKERIQTLNGEVPLQL